MIEMALPDKNSFDNSSLSPDSDENSVKALENLLGLLTELEMLDQGDEDEIRENKMSQKLEGIQPKNRYSKLSQSSQKVQVPRKSKYHESLAIKISQLEQKVNQLEKKKMTPKKLLTLYYL
ncbi:hypothetical protein cce_4706 [Crocosphaera subtropica ATCC 51142]|uniref:Uncharacterized protein n=2 Tax=Crocosphaera TaxID=263510 RepID=B1WWC6_CROS5|nr:hypothetical protein cce_4706 [Crocosphaera subtropica ATCC 51142]